jgi:MFS family permease
MEGSVKSGGLYGSALLFGGMLSFLVMGIVVDRLGWRRVALAAAGTLAATNGVLAATALLLVPYQREIDIALLILVFFCGSAFYLIPDVLINRVLREEDRPEAYARSGSLFPAVALMLTSALLFGVGRIYPPRPRESSRVVAPLGRELVLDIVEHRLQVGVRERKLRCGSNWLPMTTLTHSASAKSD